MKQEQKLRREYLIRTLKRENRIYDDIIIPEDKTSQKELLRTLMNVRPAAPIDDEFKRVQDEYLQNEIQAEGIVTTADMKELLPNIYLWKGDITRICADAIVNAANSGLTGCYRPNHKCIDNRIHTFAGVQLRNRCAAIISEQGMEEPTGRVKVTPAYNLPCKYIFHTVGPRITIKPTVEDEQTLISCYRACLEKCVEYSIGSIAFCCVATGVFGFPKRRAAELAVATVLKFKEEAKSDLKIIFDVYTDEDLSNYGELLKG